VVSLWIFVSLQQPRQDFSPSLSRILWSTAEGNNNLDEKKIFHLYTTICYNILPYILLLSHSTVAAIIGGGGGSYSCNVVMQNKNIWICAPPQNIDVPRRLSHTTIKCITPTRLCQPCEGLWSKPRICLYRLGSEQNFCLLAKGKMFQIQHLQ
jgi:hypothetical protein